MNYNFNLNYFEMEMEFDPSEFNIVCFPLKWTPILKDFQFYQ